jgi:tetraacyldisaccharide-1-P 4'-kinase
MREMVFPDHYLYSVRDLTSIEKEVRKFDYAVTTEKDMVRLNRFSIDHIPLRALKVEMRIWENEEFYKNIMELF